jgi:hypothetical protein
MMCWQVLNGTSYEPLAQIKVRREEEEEEDDEHEHEHEHEHDSREDASPSAATTRVVSHHKPRQLNLRVWPGAGRSGHGDLLGGGRAVRLRDDDDAAALMMMILVKTLVSWQQQHGFCIMTSLSCRCRTVRAW